LLPPFWPYALNHHTTLIQRQHCLKRFSIQACALCAGLATAQLLLLLLLRIC
jgi:hypothetical protein